jgi:hypothetical protein
MMLAAILAPVSSAQAAAETVSVDFSTTLGSPTYRASGTLYGMTEDGSLPQDHFYKDLKWQFERAGGAQLDSPGGWVAGKYARRWNSTLAQYKRTVALGGTFVILPHDIWGADGTTTPTFPGDNGNWTAFDAFLNQLISDLQANGMNPEWDVWNEPDCSGFWGAPQSQYLAMWQRAFHRIRSTFPSAVIVGPSTCGQPSSSNTWWATYLDYVKANNVAPDIFSWHTLPGDPVTTKNAADALLSARGITHARPYQINEYGGTAEQNPGNGGWYIARLERSGVDGLRANWASGASLHDYMANLLTKTGSQYLPKGEWFLYRFYGAMTGSRVATTASGNIDLVATKDTGSAQVLLGNHGTTGTMTVALNRLDTTSVVSNGQVRAVVRQVPNNGGGAVAGPVTISDQLLTVSGNSATVSVPWTDFHDGYTITLLPPGNTIISTVAVAQHSQLCLDDTGLSTTAGTQYQQYQCEGGYQQMLDLRPVSGVANTYTFVDELSGLCLDVNGRSTADGAAVQQWTCTGGTNQQFTLRAVTGLGSGRDFQLVAVHSGKCVDVSGVSTAPRALVHQWTCQTGSDITTLKNQVWRLLGKA